MDLDSGDEAESQFFRLQKIEKEECIFPESVWGFGAPRSQEKNSPGRKRKEAEEKKEGEDLRRSKRRKRKSSSRDKENQKRIEKKEAPSLEARVLRMTRRPCVRYYLLKFPKLRLGSQPKAM